MSAGKRIPPKLTVLVALQPLLSYQVLLAALHELADIVVRFDILYPLKDFLVLFQYLVHLTDSNGVIQRWHNLVGSVVGAILGWTLQVPLSLSHQGVLARISFGVLGRCPANAYHLFRDKASRVSGQRRKALNHL